MFFPLFAGLLQVFPMFFPPVLPGAAAKVIPVETEKPLRIFPAQGEAFPQDAWEFRLTPDEAYFQYLQALGHREFLSKTYGIGQIPVALDIDSQWCFNCWSRLDDLLRQAKNEKLDSESLRDRARDLFKLLGPDLYRARKMPPVCPEWLFKGGREPDGFIPPSRR